MFRSLLITNALLISKKKLM